MEDIGVLLVVLHDHRLSSAKLRDWSPATVTATVNSTAAVNSKLSTLN